MNISCAIFTHWHSWEPSSRLSIFYFASYLLPCLFILEGSKAFTEESRRGQRFQSYPSHENQVSPLLHCCSSLIYCPLYDSYFFSFILFSSLNCFSSLFSASLVFSSLLTSSLLSSSVLLFCLGWWQTVWSTAWLPVTGGTERTLPRPVWCRYNTHTRWLTHSLLHPLNHQIFYWLTSNWLNHIHSKFINN